MSVKKVNGALQDIGKGKFLWPVKLNLQDGGLDKYIVLEDNWLEWFIWPENWTRYVSLGRNIWPVK